MKLILLGIGLFSLGCAFIGSCACVCAGRADRELGYDDEEEDYDGT